MPPSDQGSNAWIWGAKLLLVLAVGSVACSGGPTTEEPRGERFNILLISLDTTRADHLGCYGHPESVTPNIDRLAAQGTLFEQCVAPAPTTLASHSSLLTATDPFVHGVRYNGAYRLVDENRTLAEALHDQGYATAAVLGAYVLNREFGLGQGFEEFRDLREGRPERRAADVVDDAVDWLRGVAAEDRPFFLFAHFFDPHTPYDPPDDFAGRHSSPYLGEIAYTDEQLGRLLGELDALGVAERTLVVLVGDHGESLGDHGEDTHSIFVYDSTIHVPLVLRAPGEIPAATRVASQVRLIDVAPTILAFVGAGDLPSAQGLSLLPGMGPAGLGTAPPAYSESLFPKIAFGYSPLRSLRHEGFKYVHAPTPELYDLTDDPGELRNLADSEGPRVDRMRAQLRRWIADAPVVGGADESAQTMSAEQRARLESLGYLGGNPGAEVSAGELDSFDPRGPDPKDRLEVMTLSARVLGLKRDDQLEEAEGLLMRAFDAVPAGDPIPRGLHEQLAAILVLTGRYDEAIPHYETLMASGQLASVTPTNLGGALIKVGRIDEAIEVLETALLGEPVFAKTHVNYGSALLSRNRSEQAIAHFREALEIDPDSLEAYVALGSALAGTGKTEEAIAIYRTGISRAPEEPVVRRRLAELFVAQRRPEEAMEQYQVLLRVTPNDARVHQGLGMVHLFSKQMEQAAQRLTRSVELDPGSPRAWYSLSGALAALGRLDEAISSATRAAELAEQRGDAEFAGRIRKRILEYTRARG